MSQPAPQRSVEEAQQAILAHFAPLNSEKVPLAQALGRVLAAAVTADVDLPPFDNSAMDGFAVRAADLEGCERGMVVLAVAGAVAAGEVATEQLAPGTAVRIMTGAPLPPGADLVVPFEETDDKEATSLRAEGKVRIYRASRVGANVRRAANDVRAGSTVVEAHTPITPGVVAVLASVGVAHVPVFRRPRVAILATGDELVEITERPGPGQIRNSNGYANSAQVLEAGGEVLRLPIARDTHAAVRSQLLAGREWSADLFLSSGGVSVGDYDVVKEVLTELGSLDFWRVRMKPGKPLAFGHVLGVPLLGLPGNPVSAMVTFELFGRPALRKMGGHLVLERPRLMAYIAEPIRSENRRQYLRVRLARQGDRWIAHLTGNQESNILSSMVHAEGLLVVPEGDNINSAGSCFPVILFHWPEATEDAVVNS